MSEDPGSRAKLLDAQREQADRLRSLARLAGRMAHDFNNVLMGIQPFVEVLVRQNPGNESVQKVADRINASIQRGKQLTDQVLSLTRQRTIVRKPVALAALLEEIVRETRESPDNAVEFAIEIRDPLSIEGDAALLRQGILGLLANARDAVGGRGTVRIVLARDSGDGVFPFGAVDNVARFAHLTIADSGSGMSAEAKRHAFEPLFTTHRPAMGMGLALAHQVVTGHGGHIFIDSAEGTGTTVHIFLPVNAGGD